MNTGVGSYHVDYWGCRVSYYMPAGETLTVALDTLVVEIAEIFSAAAIKSVIQGAPQGKVMCLEFKRLSHRQDVPDTPFG